MFVHARVLLQSILPSDESLGDYFHLPIIDLRFIRDDDYIVVWSPSQIKVGGGDPQNLLLVYQSGSMK